MINVILISDINGGIAKNGKIPWKFKEDLKFFKNLTTNNDTVGLFKNSVIMGRKTYESLPCDFLPGRHNIVLTRQKLKDKENVFFKNNLFEAIHFGKQIGNNIWIIGGADIYQQAINFHEIDYLYVNVIQDDFNCDQFVKYKNKNYLSSVTITCINELDKKPYNIQFNKIKLNTGVEAQYLKLLNKILSKGNKRVTRNGYTLSLFSEELKFSLDDGFPLLTTKKMFWKGIVEELLFFIRGETDTKKLEDKGVNIWKEIQLENF